MTKYVLHGGDTRVENSDNDGFFQAMTDGFTGNISILLVYFARKEEDVTLFENEDKKAFIKNGGDKEFKFETANPSTFEEQIKRSDVIYFRGGQTILLKEKLPKDLDYKNLFIGKVVGGSSAGCYILSKYHWNKTIGKMDSGLGLISIKSICHYSAEDDAIIENLPKEHEEIPLLVLPNYKWVIMFS